MDSEVKIMLDRADNEILAAKALKRLSEEEKYQQELNIPDKTTFYSSVISHSYYSIFYAARAYLIFKKVKLSSEQGIHQQVYFKFRKIIVEEPAGKEILELYEGVRTKAEVLLGIFNDEKRKRKAFTYETISQANKSPAEESITNASTFFLHIQSFIK
jgi:uncharacterized protein (UPF0332 family)